MPQSLCVTITLNRGPSLRLAVFEVGQSRRIPVFVERALNNLSTRCDQLFCLFDSWQGLDREVLRKKLPNVVGADRLVIDQLWQCIGVAIQSL